MNRLLASIGLLAALGAARAEEAPTITVPADYTSWYQLGTWSVAGEGDGAAGLHIVYTQPGTVFHYQQNGSFPDGAILVKELRKTATEPMTTGTVSRAAEIEGWFVMVKDSKAAQHADPLWGDGWGWAFFGADDSSVTTTKNYSEECLGCHLPAKATDWVYVRGYPSLRAEP